MGSRKNSDTYEKWRNKILGANLCAAIIVFALEVGIFFVLSWQNLILQSMPVYFVRFLLVPTLCDVAIMAGGILAIQKIKAPGVWRNYVPVVQMSCLCLVAAATHYVFSVTLCLFCFPIFITVLFGDQKMSRRITTLNLCFLVLALLARYYLGKLPDPYLLPESVVAVIITVSTGMICKIVIDFEKEKDVAIEQSYRKQLEMQEQLNRDQKTGLYGAVALLNTLRNGTCRQDGGPLILAVIDIDDFKRVNDSYGHSNGDKVIARLAGLMLRDSWEDIFPARFGGDEFAVVFRTDVRKALGWMESLRAQFSQEKYDFMAECVTISVGIAVWDGAESDKALFANADAAMYVSKQQGKNVVTGYSPEQAARNPSPVCRFSDG